MVGVDIDTTLVRRCQQNDRAAFDLLFDKYEGYLYRVCFGITHNREEALDVMQEVYIKIYQGIGGFDAGRPLLPWLRKIAVNTSLNVLRRKKRLKEVPTLFRVDSGDELDMADNLPAPDNTEETALLQDYREVLEEAIGQLPHHYRSALVLRYQDELSYDEIARVLEQPLGTVKNYVFRARNQLKNRLQACGYLEV